MGCNLIPINTTPGVFLNSLMYLFFMFICDVLAGSKHGV